MNFESKSLKDLQELKGIRMDILLMVLRFIVFEGLSKISKIKYFTKQCQYIAD